MSWAKASQDGAWTSKTAAVKKAEYSAYGIDFALAQIAIGTGRWNSFFARAGIEPLRLFYEDTLDDFDSVSPHIGLLAGLDAPVPRGGKLSLRRQRNEQSDEWRRRFLAECDPDDFDRPIVRLRKRRRSKWIFWRKWFRG
ncbi:Stf0 sulfotransferase family protein [Mesorhizobium sp. M0317]|uniref:Stf0 family sulfotransferase n=1 Tax=Mesorhizobium sp. M0317 TaxID=2956935 RepID=UPI003334C40C